MTTSPASKPKLEILRAEDHHADAIAEFIRQVWDPAATPASVVAARHRLADENVAEPGVIPPTYIAIQGGKVLGYVTTLAVRLWDGRGSEQPAYLLKGLMVLPQYRSGPIGYHVLKAAGELPRSAGLAVAAPALRLFSALGYRDVGAIRNFIRPLAAGRMAQKLDVEALGLVAPSSRAAQAIRFARRTRLAALAGGIGSVAASVTAAALRIPATGTRTGPFDPTGSSAAIDALWQDTRDALPSSVVRNSGYLIPRYPTGTGKPYHWYAAYRQGVLSGLVMLRQARADGDERLSGIRVATLADMVVRPDDSATILALLGETERGAGRLHADAVLMSTSNTAVERLLRRQLYVPFGGNVHLLFRDADPASPYGHDITSWYLTRGDGLADETF